MRLLGLAKGQVAGDGTAISDCLSGLAPNQEPVQPTLMTSAF